MSKETEFKIGMFLALIGMICFVTIYLKDYIYKDKLPLNKRFIYRENCGLSLISFVITYPLVTFSIYDSFIHIKYLWSNIVIHYSDIYSLTITNEYKIKIKQNKTPNVIVIGGCDIKQIKSLVDIEAKKQGITFISESL